EKKPLIDKFTDEQTSLQAQLDEVARGATNVETSQARVSSTGTAYATLKQRLDTEYEEVTTQLAQTANEASLANNNFYYPTQKIKAYDGTDGLNAETLLTADIYSLWDSLIAQQSSRINKTVLGKDESGQFDIWRLDIKP